MTTSTSNPIVVEYCRIVRHNDAVDAVLNALADPLEHGEIALELSDTAIDIGRGGNPEDGDALDRLMDRMYDLLPAVEAELS